MASAFYESATLFTASDLGIFTTLGSLGQADCTAIAEACALSERGTRLLLDACVSIELLHKDGDRYRLAEDTAAHLIPGTPGDLSGAIRYNRDVYRAWGNLSVLVKTGNPVESPEIHLGDDPQRTRAFVMAMHGRAMAIGQAVVPLLNLAGCKRLLDIGGGPGTFSTLIAKANPAIRCIVIDLPPVAAIADELIAAAQLSDRVRTLPGSYRATAFPSSNDAVIIFGVLHQESPDSIGDILKRAYAALVPGGRITIMDLMTDATHTKPKFSALFAVNMALTTPNGWVFSDEELTGWLSNAGFRDITCGPLPPPLPHWLATAQKPLDG